MRHRPVLDYAAPTRRRTLTRPWERVVFYGLALGFIWMVPVVAFALGQSFGAAVWAFLAAVAVAQTCEWLLFFRR